MKKYFLENKNIVFICTYIVVLVAIAMNYNVILSFIFTILRLLNPLFLAVGIAFVLNIPMRKIEWSLKKLFKDNHFLLKTTRILAIILTLLFAAIILYLLIIIIIPKVATSLEMVFKDFSHLFDDTVTSVNLIFKEFNINFKLQDIKYIQELQKLSWNQIFNNSIVVVSGIADWGVSNALSFTTGLFEWFLAFCLSVYLLVGKETFILQIRKVVLAFTNEKWSAKTFTIGAKANYVFTKFVGGQLVDCVIKGVMFYFVFIILGFPLPELAAMIITVFSIVPVFGPIFAMIINFVLIFAFNPLQALWFVVIFQILTNLEGQIIYPKIVGKSIGLPSIWILLSIFVLGDLYGIMGMLLAVPVTALVYEICRDFIHTKLKKKNIQIIDNKVIRGEKNEKN